MHQWESDRDFSDARVKALVAEAAPDLAGAPVRFVDEGWDFRVYLVGDDWMFRFPKRDADADAMAREARVLEEIAPSLPLPVPRYRYMTRECGGYRRLPGAALLERRSDERVAGQIGAFLAALHAFPVARARALGVREVPRGSQRTRMRAIEGFPYLEMAGLSTKGCREFLEKPFPAYVSAPAFIHADLGVEHVLVEHGSVTGVIDWTDCAVGDPALDFCGLAYSGGERLVRAGLAGYGRAVDDGFVERACRAGAYIGFIDVRYGVEAKSREHVESGGFAIKWAVEDGLIADGG